MLFEPSNLATFFFLLACIFYLQTVQADRELKDCKYWSIEAYQRLSPAAKQDLQEQLQITIDAYEDEANGDPTRDPSY